MTTESASASVPSMLKHGCCTMKCKQADDAVLPVDQQDAPARVVLNDGVAVGAALV